MIVVSDTSPIRALHFLELLPVLEELYGDIIVPTAVQRELAAASARYRQVDLSKYDFVDVRSPKDQNQVRQFLQTLQRGEAEALTLAVELNVDALLIDELDGRHVAERMGIRPLGTLGILLEAKSKGMVTELRPLIERLVDELGFFVSDALREHILEVAGE